MQLKPNSIEKQDDVTLGKILKEVENHTTSSLEILKSSYSRIGKAHVVGITGPPGAGKSTLVSKLCKQLSAQDLKIAVVCVDPTSPFTQGALLGDRIRMQEVANLPNVFIKSLATRGNLGGLAASTADIIKVLDTFDKDIILLETVGAGQIEFDVLEVSDTVVLVNVPGLGDSLQTLKAGIMEIADIFVINQADRQGADQSVKDLKMMIRESKKTNWNPPIQKTVATKDEGTTELIDKIMRHKDYLKTCGLWQEKRQIRNLTRMNQVILNLLSAKVDEHIQLDKDVQTMIQQVKRGEMDPFTVSNLIVNQIIRR